MSDSHSISSTPDGGDSEIQDETSQIWTAEDILILENVNLNDSSDFSFSDSDYGSASSETSGSASDDDPPSTPSIHDDNNAVNSLSPSIQLLVNSSDSDSSSSGESGSGGGPSASGSGSSSDEYGGDDDDQRASLFARIPNLLMSLFNLNPSTSASSPSAVPELDPQQSLLHTLSDDQLSSVGPRSPLLQPGASHGLSPAHPSPLLEPPTSNLAALLALRETSLSSFSSSSSSSSSSSPARRTLFARRARALLPSGKLSHRARVAAAGQAERFFCGQHSPDGGFFVSSCRDDHIRVLRTDDWSLRDDVRPREVSWSVVDVDLAPDGGSLLYSSWAPKIYRYDFATRSHAAAPLAFAEGHWNFCVFAVKHSPMQGRRVLAGCSRGRVAVVDSETRATLAVRVPSRSEDTEDINAVAWVGGSDADDRVFVSGSDNSLIEVWDQRVSMGIPVKQLVGHLAGVTHMHARGDGRHLISNAKDQSIRLWDLRKAHDWEPGRAILIDSAWDYRHGAHPRSSFLFSGRLRRVDDCSLMTYRGHQVHSTLIRAFFSPPIATAQRYIYSGSGNGCVFIWDALSGQIERVLPGHAHLVRDVSWHPQLPEIVSSSWDRKVYWWGAHPPKETKHLIKDERFNSRR